MRRRVVITGIGTVGGLGIGLDPIWDGLEQGRSALRPRTDWDPSGLECRLAALVEGLDVRACVPKSYRKATKVMARDVQLAVVAADLAVKDAGLRTRGSEGDGGPTYPADRLGCQIGAGLIAADQDEITSAFVTAVDDDGRFSHERWGAEGIGNLQPLWMLKYLPNMLACHVTIIHGAEGPSNTITCGESSGLLSLGESRNVIERGDALACLAGGAESKIVPLGLMRMQQCGWVAPTGDTSEGEEIVRPFDPDSPGGVPGEGAGILVLESADHASQRGARIYAELSGFGAAQSAPEDVPPMLDHSNREPDDGLIWAIERALEDAGLSAGDIDAIVPQGLGVSALDAREAGALRAVFGDRLADLPLVLLGNVLGSTAAAQGAMQAAVASACLNKQRLPARVQTGTTPEWLRAEAAPAEDRRLRHVLTCSMAHGGQNAALVVSAAEATEL